MCGIFGFFVIGDSAAPPDADLLERMSRSLYHRGPDEGGIFTNGPVALGSRRLAIVDLATGRQPLSNEDESLHLVCNGEIYNAPELRRDLERRHTFRTHSDTEVILHLYEEQGADLVDKLEGMFAFALHDIRSRRMFLARDRAGEKPLFYAIDRGVFYFASELSALLQRGGIHGEIDAEAIRLYLAFGYFPAPLTPYAGIRKMVPGTSMIVEPGVSAPRVSTYWSLRPYAIAGASRRSEAKDWHEKAREIRDLVESSVRRQLMGDVPAGVALSGGLDSGWIATVAARHAADRLHTFTVSFAESSYDESDAAAWLSTRLSTAHHVARADATSLIRAMDFLTHHMDEPLGDPAVLPTFLLAEESRRHVKVILGGEGADELFGGYPTYIGHRLASRYGKLPPWLRNRLVRPLVEALPPSDRKVSLSFLLKRFVEDASRPPLERHIAWFGALPPEQAGVVAGPLLGDTGHSGGDAAGDAATVLERLLGNEQDWGESDLERFLYLDFRTYLGDGLLTKADRVSMSCSLESRSPYLARDVVEFAARLPIDWKVRGFATKRILRAAAADVLPASILRRRKRGLSVPLAGLFRRELRSFLLDEMDPARLDREGLLRGGAVGEILRDHLEGTADRGRALWSLLSLLRWYRGQVLRTPLGPCATPASGAKSQPLSV